jgi:hypothetical protein
MTQQISDMYRGYQLVIEAAPHEARGVTLRRRITRQLGERLIVDQQHSESASYPASETVNAMAAALRDAREAVDRLLGGWHTAYVQTEEVFAGNG